MAKAPMGQVAKLVQSAEQSNFAIWRFGHLAL
jgi:hypothetical protein